MKIPQDSLHSIEARLMNTFAGICERGSWQQCRYLGSWLGLLFHGALPSRRRISISNLQLAFPQMNDRRANYLARRASQNASMTFCEFLRMKRATAQEIVDYTLVEGAENYQAAYERGRGVIFLIAHIGNWEMEGARAATEFPVTVIARPRSNKALHDHIESIRARHNVRSISRFDTGRAPIKVLRANECLGILPDQYEKGGMPMSLFGHPTRVVSAPARLALLTGAAIVPAFSIRMDPWLKDGRIRIRNFPLFTVEKQEDREAAVREGTRRMLDEIENIVTQHPDQWLWMHRRWRKEDLNAETHVASPPVDSAASA